MIKSKVWSALVKSKALYNDCEGLCSFVKGFALYNTATAVDACHMFCGSETLSGSQIL
jgi:hypothetical protein